MAKVHSAFTYGQYPDALLWDKSASSNAGRLFAALSRYAAQRLRERPGNRELADRLGWSESTLQRAKRELIQRDLLRVDETTGPGGRREENDYHLGPFAGPPVVTGDRGEGVTGDNDVGVTDDNPKNLKGKTSPNGDGGLGHQDGRSDTIVGQCLDALGFRPVEMGAFAKIVTEAEKSVSSPDLIVRAVRDWGAKGEPVSYLTGSIGQLDRAARGRRAKAASSGASQQRHDGAHDPDCWCYQVPEDQRAKVHRGDLLRAAGLAPRDVEAQIAAEDAAAQAEGRCCHLHTRTCEPPSELCCERCTEARHPDHPDGELCVLGVTAE
jgi:hypothetical protein